jgi:hypothetical protein
MQCEVIGRQRRLHLGMLMGVMVIAAETPGYTRPTFYGRIWAVSCQSIAQDFYLKGVTAKRRWQQIAAWLTHSGRSPNWRC